MSHGDRITELPPGFRALAHSDSSPYAVMANDRGLIGLQFHPEVVHTPNGKQLLENFLLRVCGCRGDWTAGNFIADSILRIREQVGGGRVICALSGGVDSAVTAALIHRAIGDQLTCIFVNNGLLRREEPERVVDTFHRPLSRCAGEGRLSTQQPVLSTRPRPPSRSRPTTTSAACRRR